jgi:uncharacterized phiE125 gp8 family phage protein
MLTVLSLSGAEPVTAAEARLAARIDGAVLDPFVDTIISSACRAAEQITGRCFRPQTLRAELADWPTATEGIEVHRATGCVVKYWDGAGMVALDPASFVFAPGGRAGAQTVLAPMSAWPALGARPVGPRVQIDLEVNAVDPVHLPAVKLYIIAQVAHWHDNPSAVQRQDFVPSPLFERLLNPAKLWT